MSRGLSDTLDGQDREGSDDRAGSGDCVQDAVAAADSQNGRRHRRRDRERKSTGDVEHPEVLGGVVTIWHDGHYECEVDARTSLLARALVRPSHQSPHVVMPAHHIRFYLADKANDVSQRQRR